VIQSPPKSEVSPSIQSNPIPRFRLIRAHQPPIPFGNHPSSSTIKAARSTTRPGHPTGTNNAGNSSSKQVSPRQLQQAQALSSPAQFGQDVPFIRARLRILANQQNGPVEQKSEAAIDKNTKLSFPYRRKSAHLRASMVSPLFLKSRLKGCASADTDHHP